MTRMKMLTAAIVVSGLLLGTGSAGAHCDALGGPVANAAQKSLVDGNVNPVLAYAPGEVETEIRAAFDQARQVRALGAVAQTLADRSFMETVIRLHRAGEGAAYTGLKPAGADYGPVIPAAEHAVETGDLAKLKTVLAEEIERALSERLGHVRELQKHSLDPKTAVEVPNARARISAELGLITFAEKVHQVVLGKGAEQNVD